MTSNLHVISSGEWQRHSLLHDYRAEWFSDLLVERATWSAAAALQKIGQTVIAAPQYVWCRFWLARGQSHMVEKYFDDHGQPRSACTRASEWRCLTWPRLQRHEPACWASGSQTNARVTVLNEALRPGGGRRARCRPSRPSTPNMVIRE
jgi:hypothetical protein